MEDGLKVQKNKHNSIVTIVSIQTEIYCNIIDVFTVTFGQFIASLLNKTEEKIFPKLLNCSVKL